MTNIPNYLNNISQDNFGNNAKYAVLEFKLNHEMAAKLECVAIEENEYPVLTMRLTSPDGTILSQSTTIAGEVIKSISFNEQTKSLDFIVVDAFGRQQIKACSLQAFFDNIQADLTYKLSIMQVNLSKQFAVLSAQVKEQLAKKPGIMTENGGEVFNDYANNVALGQYSHAQGEKTKALGQASTTSGYGTTAGARGYILKNHTKSMADSIDPANYPFVWDVEFQTEPVGFSVGDIVSIAIPQSVNGEWVPKVNNGKIMTISGTTATIATTIQTWLESNVPSRLANSIYVLAKPAVGDAEISGCATASGYNTRATGHISTASGIDTAAIGDYSYAEGIQTKALGGQTHAQGNRAQAIGHSSHAQNIDTRAIGIASHAQGRRTRAEGLSAHAQGTQTIASGENSHTHGFITTASGRNATATGDTTIASGDASTTFGVRTRATGLGAVAEGLGDANSGASGEYAHTQGYYTTASARAAHAQGARTEAAHNYSHAAGRWTKTGRTEQFVTGTYNQVDNQALFVVGCGTAEANRKNAAAISATEARFAGKVYAAGKQLLDVTAGEAYINTKVNTVISQKNLVNQTELNTILTTIDAENANTYATKQQLLDYSTTADIEKEYTKTTELQQTYTSKTQLAEILEGYSTAQEVQTTYATKDQLSKNYVTAGRLTGTATGNQSTAEGVRTTASATASHAEGLETTASAAEAHAQGIRTLAGGTAAHAEGVGTIATGGASHAEGKQAKATGLYSHAEGNGTIASGERAHAQGYQTTASGADSHAEGQYTGARGIQSHAQGFRTIATGKYQHVEGRYNIEDSTDTFAHIVGNGTSSARNNAHTLDWNGNAWYAGKVRVGGTNYDDASTVATVSQLNTSIQETKQKFVTDLNNAKQELQGTISAVQSELTNNLASTAGDLAASTATKVAQDTFKGTLQALTNTEAISQYTTDTELQQLIRELRKQLPVIESYEASGTNNVTIQVTPPKQDWSVAYVTANITFTGTPAQNAVVESSLHNMQTEPSAQKKIGFNTPWGQVSGIYSFRIEKMLSKTVAPNIQQQQTSLLIVYTNTDVPVIGSSLTIAVQEELLQDCSNNGAFMWNTTYDGITMDIKLTIKWI